MQRFKVYAIVLINAICVLAQSAPAPKPNSGGLRDPSFIFMMVIMFAIIYFLMLRPQMRKQKETQNMLNNLKKGDKVLTLAGIIGVVGNVKDSTVMVKVADNTVLEFKKAAISTVIQDDKEAKAASGEKDKSSK